MKKTLIISLVIAGIIFALFKLVPLLVNSYLNQNAERIVSNMITRTNDFAGHEVQFGNIQLDYDYRGTFLKMESVEISPGQDLNTENKIKFHLRFEEASLTGFQWIDFLFFNSIQLDSAYIENADLKTVTPDLEEIQEGQPATNPKEGKDYRLIGLNYLRVNGVSFENRDSKTDSIRLSMTDLFVFADGFSLSKEDKESSDALFSVKSIEGYLAETQLHVNNAINVIMARDISFNTTDRRMIVEQVSYKNKLDKYEFVNRYEKETNWMELSHARLQLDGMDFQSYFREGVILVDTMRLDGLELEVFRDKRKVEDTSRRPKMIHEILEELPRQVHLQTISLADITITYEERPDTKALAAGKIFFDQVSGEITGFTNIAEALSENDTLKVSAKGRLMGQGQIDLQANHLINSEMGTFFLQGKVGQMSLPTLNDMIMPATRIALKSGRLNDLYFNITADDIEGTGEVIAKYEDLEIEILDKNYQQNQNLLRKIGAFLANKVVIPTNNPDNSGNLSKGAVYFEREQHKFIFHYWWNLILSGLKSTITGQTAQEMKEK
ncbi:DUF748 domain-containing protein [Cyclobacterium jeungdonense]|uniref:DUF748 domain-containing protein n=1 Tax=Cyclobacterium jeungdonense TaxID=708087 RepID=A0ABT8C367_9BACT|nr:DUF748 domain-containing protein [Cyclobacterium jeungdonense]MDN3687220.1 DUF748 domain-containing protein [Cyclobacterium jeungdonense]